MNIFEGPAILTNRSGKGLETNRPPVVDVDDGRQELSIEVVEAETVDLHLFEAPLGGLEGHRLRAEVMCKVANPAQQPIGDPGSAARALGYFSGGIGGNLHREDSRRPRHDLRQMVARVELEAAHNAETITQRSGEKAGSGRGSDQREAGQSQPNAPRRRTLTNDQVEFEIFHRRIENLFHRRWEAVDFVDEEHVTGAQVCQHGREIAGTLEHGSGREVDLGVHLGCDDQGEGGLAKSRGPEEEGMVEGFISIARRIDENPEVRRQAILPHKLAQTPGPEGLLVRAFVRLRITDEDFFGHALTLPHRRHPPNPGGSNQ